MKKFVIADTHFGHTNIIEYCDRPFRNREHMDSILINNWNSIVEQNDIVYILGDFSFYNKEKTKEIIDMLNGYKILIMGNHDRGHSIYWWRDAGMDEVYKNPISIYADGISIKLSHEPLATNDMDNCVNIYGHVHNDPNYETITNESICVSAERHKYMPVLIDNLINKLHKEYPSIEYKEFHLYLDDYDINILMGGDKYIINGYRNVQNAIKQGVRCIHTTDALSCKKYLEDKGYRVCLHLDYNQYILLNEFNSESEICLSSSFSYGAEIVKHYFS